MEVCHMREVKKQEDVLKCRKITAKLEGDKAVLIESYISDITWSSITQLPPKI